MFISADHKKIVILILLDGEQRGQGAEWPDLAQGLENKRRLEAKTRSGAGQEDREMFWKRWTGREKERKGTMRCEWEACRCIM